MIDKVMKIYLETCDHINDIEREKMVDDPGEPTFQYLGSWASLMNRIKSARLRTKLIFLLLDQIAKEDGIVEPSSIGGDWMLYRWNDFLNLLRSDEKIKHLMAEDPIFKATLDELKIDKLDFETSSIMEKYFEQVEKIKENNKRMKELYKTVTATYTLDTDNYYEC